eukprot:CAMPEP_0172562226 /NCGR_PEP_ID=MMETSP1067-20121228/96098_1 /TAXON_ID=265564 ORGANISM="Thalassiosira punctigera, Strain Tpunct2005C2" /NCGR_SAMPLE_ID=MMETSP1067 /ASSEMBLY_ACC=CAM_ASM_000444 /LENGTH=182 /DNA_ID=CAMNT_0013352419 /DNA_START=111 /DNA_END=656 /DNA_ORIENTATION=-
MLPKRHSSILTAALGVSTLNSRAALSQQAPYYNLTQFEPIPEGAEIPRQDLCGRLRAFERGEVELANALKGLDLHPAIAGAEYVILDEEGKLDEDYPGLLPTLLDEIGRRAGFRWRDSFALTWPPEMTEVWKKKTLLLLGFADGRASEEEKRAAQPPSAPCTEHSARGDDPPHHDKASCATE